MDSIAADDADALATIHWPYGFAQGLNCLINVCQPYHQQLP